MFRVFDLDSKRQITTGSEKLATQYWHGVEGSGGTPFAERHENHKVVRWTPIVWFA